MEIKRVGSQPSSRGSADYFTGAVRLDPGYHDDAATQALRKLGVCDVIEERIREPSAS